jgi:ankyrin repeat protein
LAAKADVNVTTKNGLTALILAANKGRIEIVKALLEAKANVNATISMKGKTYTLLSIIPERHKETISLLKEYGAK